MSLWRSDAPFLVGHRGGRGPDWPAENTLAAFERAVREGAPAIELDVRLDARGEVVVFHDEDLARLTDGRERAPIEALSSQEVRRLRLGDEPVPFLDDVLTWARERGVALNIELKHGGGRLARLAVGVARALAATPVDAIVSSFHPMLLSLFALAAPGVPRALLTAAEDRFGRAAAAQPPPAPWLAALHLEAVQATCAHIEQARRRGLRVGVWTVNESSVAAHLLRDGASWLVTDDPRRLRAGLPESSSRSLISSTG